MPKVAALALLGLLAPFQLTDGAMIPRQTTDFGVCTNPTIMYVQDQDGMLGYGYKPSNTNDFHHGATADIATIIDFIRSTLQNACRAPTTAWFLYTTAAAAANGKEGQDAADAFNNVMNQSSPQSEASQAPAPAVSSAAVQPSLNMKFSKETVVFGDHIDPIWWFNEYLKADGQPAICDETPHRMPNDHYITFTCEGADPNIVPMMKEALIAVVKDTIDNTALPDDQRMFMHREGLCWDGHNNQCHITEGYPSTVFPQSVHVAVAIEVPGTGGAGALSGNLRYNIADSSSNNCGMCSYLSTSGGAVSALTSVAQVVMGFSELIGPGIAVANAAVSFSCLTTC
ncbi:hypothetical protein FOPG_12758 [Fusarium oxysporum f. sp. conglutinans race 2 54008]|uniref:Uncharacterized protein n=2 Tax=Fusarium oxysporum f. sp. conglutinans TaxID=100902 RepID=A0A8H6LKC4_FUSOX|nr:hypothetical protein FOPG_12758 [Fusarium oxysporum f. sp. conglutinans race 2 54008]KAF6523309.1 hypothetical protein HZS61_011808 [Fusarium oxysporum f. sp. conglutinans]KAI8410749.1 hypothetical protein FOFC_10607 [Fusarium oxysporum]